MIITIVQSEIEKAIEDYVASKIKINDNQQFKIELSATRGSQGITANITINNDCNDTVPTVTKECSHEEETTFTANSEEETQTQTQTQAQDTTQDTTQESNSIFTQPEKKKNPFADL